jgi:prepilin-type N-terminal cleavage/methylation domain-containing protein
MKKQKGFTLIELMVVMAIIAILATAGLTAYSNYLKKARDSSRALVARQVLTAVESLANGGPLPSPSDLTTYLTNEGFAYTLPTMNPLIARVSGIVDNVLGTALAVNLDPFGPSSGPCLAEPDPISTG